MIGKRENFKMLKYFDGGYVRFGDDLKEESIGIRSITLNSLCDLIEVYLVDVLNTIWLALVNYVMFDLKSPLTQKAASSNNRLKILPSFKNGLTTSTF